MVADIFNISSQALNSVGFVLNAVLGGIANVFNAIVNVF